MAALEKRLGSWGHTFLKKTWDFFIFLLYPWKFQKKNKTPPLQILQDCVTSLGNSMAKNHQAPPPACKLQIPHNFFLFTPGNSACYLFNTPGDSIFSSPPYHWSPILTQNIVPSLASYDYNRYELKQRLWNIMYKGDCLLKLQPLYFFALIFHAKLNALLDEIWNSYIFTLTTEWMLK